MDTCLALVLSLFSKYKFNIFLFRFAPVPLPGEFSSSFWPNKVLSLFMSCSGKLSSWSLLWQQFQNMLWLLPRTWQWQTFCLSWRSYQIHSMCSRESPYHTVPFYSCIWRKPPSVWLALNGRRSQQLFISLMFDYKTISFPSKLPGALVIYQSLSF